MTTYADFLQWCEENGKKPTEMNFGYWLYNVAEVKPAPPMRPRDMEFFDAVNEERL